MFTDEASSNSPSAPVDRELSPSISPRRQVAHAGSGGGFGARGFEIDTEEEVTFPTLLSTSGGLGRFAAPEGVLRGGLSPKAAVAAGAAANAAMKGGFRRAGQGVKALEPEALATGDSGAVLAYWPGGVPQRQFWPPSPAGPAAAAYAAAQMNSTPAPLNAPSLPQVRRFEDASSNQSSSAQRHASAPPTGSQAPTVLAYGPRGLPDLPGACPQEEPVLAYGPHGSPSRRRSCGPPTPRAPPVAEGRSLLDGESPKRRARAATLERARRENLPLKVGGLVASRDTSLGCGGTPPGCGLDPSLPVKKRSAFADEFKTVAPNWLNPNLPVKKQVPDFLLQDVPHLVDEAASLPTALASAR
eukprot:TRINITY_DN17886_c0_g1_i1.p1 TRINITY_DN17886_c0_g1~~TRINITY_DN17886_c0_g1_i1.p1  ORF type:complete len:358 (+),score=59.61 TRINITY_DN17886_c0_g1_i1:736-1809(+)